MIHDFPISADGPVLLTGATGYLAGWILEGLLAAGLDVHATVRDPQDTEALRPLREMAAELPGRLTFFGADLLRPGAFNEAMRGCGVVIHTAAPYASRFEDAREEIVDPTVFGAMNVLEAADRSRRVKRVVMTGSFTAICGYNEDMARAPGGCPTEAQWNDSSTLKEAPYAFSKTQAERAAWRIADAQARWRLVVLNPCLIVGPDRFGRTRAESFALPRQMGSGRMRGVAPLEIGMVDVRDVAEAHLRAAFLPGAGGRNILFGGAMPMRQMVAVLKQRYPGLPVPEREAPVWLLRLVGRLKNPNLTPAVVRRSLNRPWRADTGKARRELGQSFRSPDAGLVEMFEQLVANGDVPEPR